MSLYCGVDGAIKKINSLYTNIDGSTKQIKEMYVGIDGANTKLYQAEKSSKIIAAWFTTDEQEIHKLTLKKHKRYDIWVIGEGTSGSRGGDNWGLYKGKGGGCGASGSAAHFSFVTSSNKLYLNSSMTIADPNLPFKISVQVQDGIQYSNTFLLPAREELLSTDAENAGAFNPNPDGGLSGQCATDFKLSWDNDILFDTNYEIIKETFLGNPTTRIRNNSRDGMPAQNAATTPFSTPPYLAGAGQDAYYSTDINNICLGNAGGGGNGGGQAGGKGAPGGVIIIEEDV